MNKLFASILLLISFSICALAQSEPFYFIQITDPQLGMLEQNKRFTQETKIMEKTIAKVNLLNPACIIFTGDLVNDSKDQKQIAEFKRLCSLIRKDIPYYVLPGNHDIDQKATDSSIQHYMDEYGYDCFSFQMHNCQFIGINTQIIFGGREELEKNQMIWMEKELQNSQRCNHRILFGHYPFFTENPSEPDKYMNLPLARRQSYLDMMEKYHVNEMFVGHLHKNVLTSYKDFHITITNSICTPLGDDKIGLRIIKVYPDRIEHTYYDLDKIPSKVDL